MIKQFLRSILFRIRGEYTTEKLIKMGLRVGKNFARLHGVVIDPAHCWLIEIGNDVTLAPRVIILAHDASTMHYFRYAKIGRVIIGNCVFIGADTIVLPNVKIGDNVIIGANSTVTHNLDGGFVYAGSPARKICSIEDFIKKNKQLIKNAPCYSDDYTIRKKIDAHKKEQMIRELTNGFGFVE